MLIAAIAAFAAAATFGAGAGAVREENRPQLQADDKQHQCIIEVTNGRSLMDYCIRKSLLLRFSSSMTSLKQSIHILGVGDILAMFAHRSLLVWTFLEVIA
ncbi:unnamed protein product [Strongylus vulgaris]|uniref:Secreted protein n=1 Tax=Strongylus vulgaris TaxID=40348 RepID=A0A3P7I9W5_STRVU|nr:unnamed protein product [Strongylus vulgaris]